MTSVKNTHGMELRIQPKLPTPDSTYITKHATFEVYRAKDLYNKKWRNSVLHKLVGFARTSYGRYGLRSLFDEYDLKAAIYLARATYEQKTSHGGREVVSEWLSVRMVPGDGEFKGVGEPELYTFKNTPVSELLRQKMKLSKGKFWSHIVSDSRMCGIHPYAVTKNNKVVRVPTERHQYTAECMALMQAQFMVDFSPSTLSFQYVSAIVKPEIRDKVITLRKKKLAAKPNFISAHKTLGLSKAAEVTVDRSAYTYQFPRYWLNMKELKSLLHGLVGKKKLSEETFKHYLLGHSLDSVNGEINLGNMLAVKGPLVKASITGSKLRELVDKHVSDTPELQIIPINAWRRGFLRLLKIAGINVFKKHPELSKFLL